MKKIETVWCELLFEALEKGNPYFQQQKLAQKLDLSTSTVNLALKDLRRMGAVEIGGDGGTVRNAEKILMHWASHRELEKDIVFTKQLAGSVAEIEGLLPPDSILGAYSAVRQWYKEAPANYNSVYVYHLSPRKIEERFANHEKGETKLIVLQLKPKIPLRSETTSLAHTFVDLWNISDWMASDFIRRIREEIDELLSR